MKPTRLILLLLVFLLAAVCSAAAPAKAKSAHPAAGAHPHVALDTAMGKIVIELYPDKAPKSVANFLRYVKAKHYDGTIFHRVIPGFMVQGGGFTPAMVEKPTQAPVQNEASNGLGNNRATLAMARTSDPNSATAQFFINVKDNAALNFRGKGSPGYTVFGKVIEGMDVVDKIVAVPTTTKGGNENVPRNPIVIRKAQVVP